MPRSLLARAALAALAALAACARVEVQEYETINGDLGGSMDVFGGIVAPPAVTRLTLARVGDRVIAVGERLVITLESQRPDGGGEAPSEVPVEYSLRSELPPGATFDKDAGRFDWTPEASLAGSLHTLTFEVTDGDEVARETITVRVLAEGEESALPPSVDSLGDHSLTAEQPWSLQVVASDPNGDPLTYALAEGAPEGLLLSAEGALSWTPSRAQAGEHSIEVVVSDGVAETRAPARLVVQLPGGVNRNVPPVFEEPALDPLTAGQPFSYTFVAQDDGDAPLTYGVEGAPAESSFDPATGRFEWTPSNDYANTAVTLRVSASDGEFTSFVQVSLVVRLAPRDCAQPREAVVESFPIELGAEVTGRYLCNEGDIDSVSLTLRSRARLQIDATFTHEVGDVDIKLFDEAGDDLYRSLGVLDNERIETRFLEPGRYTIEVKLFNNGPVTYDLRVEELAADPACAPDAFEGAPHNDTVAEAAALPTGRRHDGLALCRGDVDAYTFTASRGQPIGVTLSSERDEPISLSLLGPSALRSSGAGQEWTSASGELSPVAPESGAYVLLVGRTTLTPSALYSLTVTLSATVACAADRIEVGDGNDDPGRAEFLAPNLYSNLTSCADPNDWYRARPSGGGARVFVGYSAPATAPTMTALDAAGNPLPGATFSAVPASSTPGCMSERARCYKASLPTPPGGGEVYFSVRFDEVGASYDLRVQSGL